MCNFVHLNLDNSDTMSEDQKNVYLSALFAGAAAALAVDSTLFPLDTLTTRLQSARGFFKTGGFKHVYKGIGPQTIGSAPEAALFFLTYESFKYYVEPRVDSDVLPLVYMTAATAGEIVSCLIGAPVEVVKQRRQTSTNIKHTSMRIFMHAVKSEGLIKGLYRGYGSMLIQEIPFSLIQFPVLEYLKKVYRVSFKNDVPLDSWDVANCGAVAAAFAAMATTPLDVAKTRVMLADKKFATDTIKTVLKQIYYEKGFKGLFAGFTPRVMLTTIGAYVFFGTYDLSKNFCNDYLLNPDPTVNW
ncbi:mitochondrial S-adenosylmethionine carrier protein-like [Zophobas morio]|uniref:mitochondrial S-adenosylmethionine carrier protein-like n=1 Tax=Zophobas morio TaxID=2755281 RepID=UPI003082DC0B